MDLERILAALGLPAVAGEEEILNAIEALKQAATMAQNPEGVKAEFAQRDQTIKLQTDRIAKLERDARVKGYEEVTTTFKAIEGDPKVLAIELADMEEASGKEAVDKLVAHYRKVNMLGQAALKAKGTEQKSDTTDARRTHAFAVKAQERADKEGITFQRALVLEKEGNPEGYRDYRRAVEG